MLAWASIQSPSQLYYVIQVYFDYIKKYTENCTIS